jgi:hypothetical protein
VEILKVHVDAAVRAHVCREVARCVRYRFHASPIHATFPSLPVSVQRFPSLTWSALRTLKLTSIFGQAAMLIFVARNNKAWLVAIKHSECAAF